MVGYNDPLCDISTWKKRSPYFIKAGPPEARRYPGFHPHSVETPEGLLIEYDVAVPLRDGVKMYVDIYRPAKQDSSTKIPCVIAWTPVPPLPLKFTTGCWRCVIVWKTSSCPNSIFSIRYRCRRLPSKQIHRLRSTRSSCLVSTRICNSRHRPSRNMEFRRRRKFSNSRRRSRWIRSHRMDSQTVLV